MSIYGAYVYSGLTVFRFDCPFYFPYPRLIQPEFYAGRTIGSLIFGNSCFS